jgi:hypothetical protein
MTLSLMSPIVHQAGNDHVATGRLFDVLFYNCNGCSELIGMPSTKSWTKAG